MRHQHVWVEIVVLGTAIAVVLALLIATLGFVVGVAAASLRRAASVKATGLAQLRPLR